MNTKKETTYKMNLQNFVDEYNAYPQNYNITIDQLKDTIILLLTQFKISYDCQNISTITDRDYAEHDIIYITPKNTKKWHWYIYKNVTNVEHVLYQYQYNIVYIDYISFIRIFNELLLT